VVLRHITKLSSPPAQGRWDREHHAPNRRCAPKKKFGRLRVVGVWCAQASVGFL